MSTIGNAQASTGENKQTSANVVSSGQGAGGAGSVETTPQPPQTFAQTASAAQGQFQGM